MCCCAGLTSCCGGSCGYCSECVGTAACNTELCSSCISGAVACIPVCTPTSGSGTCICTNTSTSCTPVDVSACLPFAGTDANGNDIYQNPDGSLTYSDGSPATRSDIACNCGACIGTPCSPHTCGTTCQPPSSCGGGKSAGAPQGGGSGGGTAKPSAGQTIGKSNPPCTQMAKLTAAMSRFGSSITSLLTGGKAAAAKNVLPGQRIAKSNVALTPNSYLLVILIVGGLLLFLAFGHKPTAD
jgi:hypothetical protein